MTMFRKLSLVLGIAIIFSSMPVTSITQTKPEVHHNGVKRTYNKVKQKTKKAWKNTKSTTARKYNKVKTRIKKGDAKQDAQEKK